MNNQQLLEIFIVDSRERLEDMESGLLTLAQSTDQDEAVNGIFRAAHTIKGSAGVFALDHLVRFTHAVEGVLDLVRGHQLPISEALVSLLLKSTDHISALVEAVASGRLEPDPELSERGAPLHAELEAYLAEPARVEAPPAAAGCWHISVRFGREVLRSGLDPLLFIRQLAELGRIRGLVAIDVSPEDLAEVDPEVCTLGFELGLETSVQEAALAGVFKLVAEESRLCLLPPGCPPSAFFGLIEQLGEDPDTLRRAFVRAGTVSAEALEAEQADQTGLVIFDQAPAEAPAKLQAAPAREAQKSESRSIRVDADRLDHLINLVGELIIAAASADLIGRRARLPELQEATSTMSTLVQEIRDNALQLRMVKIGATFNRFHRVVHDVARELGKDIELVVSGEDTELDKTVVEKIGDPLMHLVRNAMDHGIEAPEQRAARGKPAKGTVRLDAYHDSGSIVIEVSDDGGGLKREKIMAKAVERGLVEPGRELSDGELYALIFEPGFSTADQVTNLSGRGVGMDVVKRNITALRGSVEMSSEEGVGTTVTVRLPLTLAIINGFLVGLGKSVYVVPLDMIEECVEFSAEPGANYTSLRGQALPFIRLRELFGGEGARAKRENIVVIRYGKHRAGLVVDTLLGEFQTVIKPLAKIFNQVRCISGSTILGNGEVALILDVPALVKDLIERGSERAHSAA